MDKKAFSLIELIFIIIVMAVIASVAVPKLFDIKSKSEISTIKQDISTTISSIQNYYLVNGKIDKISDAVALNSSVWDIADTTVKYKENSKDCVDMTLSSNSLVLTIDKTAGPKCLELYNDGIVSTTYNLK
jgi:general secretion pathway protein G